MSNDRPQNAFGEDLFLPPTFVNPNTGRYKDMPEKWFEGRLVRILLDVQVESAPFKLPVWLRVLRFEDKVLDGHPLRLGLGVTETPINCDTPQAPGKELSFHPEEVFDVTEPQPKHEGSYVQLSNAPTGLIH